MSKPSYNTTRVNLVPFTGGLVFPIYAFFWPEGFGHWAGTIVHTFRLSAGF